MEQLSCLLVFAWDGMANTSLFTNLEVSTQLLDSSADLQCWSNLIITTAQTLASYFM